MSEQQKRKSSEQVPVTPRTKERLVALRTPFLRTFDEIVSALLDEHELNGVRAGAGAPA